MKKNVYRIKDTNNEGVLFFLYNKVMAGTAIMVRGGISVGPRISQELLALHGS